MGCNATISSRVGLIRVAGGRPCGEATLETIHSPMPVRTKNPVIKRPKSIAELLELSIKSSGFAHRPHIQFGRGAMM